MCLLLWSCNVHVLGMAMDSWERAYFYVFCIDMYLCERTERMATHDVMMHAMLVMTEQEFYNVSTEWLLKHRQFTQLNYTQLVLVMCVNALP